MQKKSKTMRLEPSLIKKIEQQAKKEKRTFTNMCEVLLEDSIKQGQ